MSFKLINTNGTGKFTLVNNTNNGHFRLLNTEGPIPPPPQTSYLLLAENEDALTTEDDINIEYQY